MNSIAANNSGPRGTDLLKIHADARQMNCHVSQVIYKIRDHGPAILDGEFYKVSSNAYCQEGLPEKANALAAAAPAPEMAASTPVESKSEKRGVIRTMLFSIFLLTIALVSVGFYAYQQKMLADDLQAELEIYDELDKTF
jgi:hypothetical protein